MTTLSTPGMLIKKAELGEVTVSQMAAPMFQVVSMPDKTVMRTADKRRARIDWYALAILMLMLASGAMCLYRLIWAASF